MIEDVNLHGYASSTKGVFLKAVLELRKFFNKNPGDITEDEIRKYFLILKNDLQSNLKQKKPPIQIYRNLLKTNWQKTESILFLLLV